MTPKEKARTIQLDTHFAQVHQEPLTYILDELFDV